MSDINGAINLLVEHVKRMTEELAEVKSVTKNVNTDIYDLKLSVSRINEKLDYSVSTIKSTIDNTDRRFTDFKEEQSKSLAKWAVAATLFIGAIQAVISIVLYFWK